MKEKIVVISFVSVLFIFMILSFLLPDKKISFSERRTLASFPVFEWQEVIGGSGNFFEDMNDYFVDQFPFRDMFRKMKGITLTNVFHKTENHGVFVQNDTIFQLDATLNEKSVEHLMEKIAYVEEEYLTSKKVYFAMVPDKNYYLRDHKIPKLDYLRLENLLKNSLPSYYQWIDLTSSLRLSSYYRTDIHWKQEALKPVVSKLREDMHLEHYSFPTEKETYYPFYGALYGRIATNVAPDTLMYLTDSVISDAKVYHYEKNKEEKVYEKKYLKNVDSYDVFLAGATPLLIIHNPKQDSGKELILFRDSFGSSLVPLLIPNYSKITVIDLRYISSSLLGNIPEIDVKNEKADVLFLYSVPIINNSFTLK